MCWIRVDCEGFRETFAAFLEFHFVLGAVYVQTVLTSIFAPLVARFDNTEQHASVPSQQQAAEELKVPPNTPKL